MKFKERMINAIGVDEAKVKPMTGKSYAVSLNVDLINALDNIEAVIDYGESYYGENLDINKDLKKAKILITKSMIKLRKYIAKPTIK